LKKLKKNIRLIGKSFWRRGSKGRSLRWTKFKEEGLRYFRKLERKREQTKKLLERIDLKQ
jgi:hypothetical protein